MAASPFGAIPTAAAAATPADVVPAAAALLSSPLPTPLLPPLPLVDALRAADGPRPTAFCRDWLLAALLPRA